MDNIKRDCFFYLDIRDMGGHIPQCAFKPGSSLGYCPCGAHCSAYISKTDATEIVRNAVKEKEKKNGHTSC